MYEVKSTQTKIERLEQCKIIKTKNIHIEFKIVKCKLTVQVVLGWNSCLNQINRQCSCQFIIKWLLDA